MEKKELTVKEILEKKDVKDAQEIENELRRCADVISQTDEDMLKIRKRIFSDEAARSENHSFW